MRKSEFWVMCKKSNTEPAGNSRAGYPSGKLPSVVIVELTLDETIYIWPVEPIYDSLCLACAHQNCRCSEVCKPVNVPGAPCLFQPVPETEVSQDFDDVLYDGDFLEVCGYFYSFHDFRRQNGYSDECYFCFPLGCHSSIREARLAFSTVLQAGKEKA